MLFYPGLTQATDNNGNPASGAKWYFYLTGTTTPATVYGNDTLATSLGAVVTADSSGWFASIYLDDTVTYRAVLKTSAGAIIGGKDIDPVTTDAGAALETALASDAGSNRVGHDPEGTYTEGTVGDALTNGQYWTTTEDPEFNGQVTFVYEDGVIKVKVRDSSGDVVYGTIDTVTPAAELFIRPIFGWNGTAGLDSARFPSFVKITNTTGLIAYSPRDDFNNDGEIGMRLDVVPYTLNTTTQAITLGSVVTVATPSGFASGTGAFWQAGMTRLASGRILLFAVELNSPDGTYTHVDSRYDLVMFYSDDGGATWSAKQSLFPGETVYTTFGLADYNSAAAGFEVPGGVNTVVQTASGRIIVTGFLRNSPNHYLASVYTDAATGTTGWTAGTALVYPNSNYSEPSVSVLGDGTLRAFVRREDTEGTGIFKSIDEGVTWTFDRFATETGIENAPSAAYAENSRVLIGGATTDTDNRQGYSLFNSTNSAASFGAGITRLFPRKQRVGYAHLGRIAPGYWGMIFETTSTQAPNSFNKTGSISMAVFNDEILSQDLATGAHDSTLYNATTEYAAYAAYVTGDGGTVVSPTNCLAAITAAIAGNYYSKIGFAASAEWGGKSLTSGTSAKLYSIGPFGPSSYPASNSTGLTTSFALDTTTIAGRTLLKCPDSGAFTKFTSKVLRAGSKCAFIVGDKAADTSAANGFGIQWTDSVSHYVFAGGTFNINGTAIVQGSPEYTTDENSVSHFIIDFDARQATHGHNGTDMQTVSYFTKYSNAGATFDFKLAGVGGADRLMPEAWHLNATTLTEAMARQCATDVNGRW